MKAVIIAAGRGQRLHPMTENLPKPLVEIFGEPLIGYTIDSLRQLSVTDIIIVVGYHGKLIREYFSEGTNYGVHIQYVENLEFKKGNATSVLSAEPLLEKEDPFLLIMADHIIEHSIIQKALRSADLHPFLCVDQFPQHEQPLDDATRVLVDEQGYICDIGKQIHKYNAFDTGVFVLDTEVLEMIQSISSNKQPFTLNHCWQLLIPDNLQLWACDVSGLFWFDVDTKEDLYLAKKALENL